MNNIKSTQILLTSFLVILLSTFFACEKLEIPKEPSTPTEENSTPNPQNKEEDTPTDEKENSDTPSNEDKDSPSEDEGNNPTDIDKDSMDLSTLQDTIDFVESWGSEEEYGFTVHDVRHIIPTYFRETGAIGMDGCYVGGYIVGCIPQHNNKISRMVFSPADVKTNIVIADSPDETDYNECIAIKLSTSTAGQQEVREFLNLSDHPENLGTFIEVLGKITQYMGVLGVTNVGNVIIDREDDTEENTID